MQRCATEDSEATQKRKKENKDSGSGIDGKVKNGKMN